MDIYSCIDWQHTPLDCFTPCGDHRALTLLFDYQPSPAPPLALSLWVNADLRRQLNLA